AAAAVTRVRVQSDLDRVQIESVAEWYQLLCPFRGQDAGDSRGPEDVALLVPILNNQAESVLVGKDYAATRSCRSRRDRLCRNGCHVRCAAGRSVRQTGGRSGVGFGQPCCRCRKGGAWSGAS